MTMFFPFLTNEEKDNIVELKTRKMIEGNNYRLDYVDDKGKVTIYQAKGYSTMKQVRDADGHAIEEYYYNINEQPVMCSGGYYGVHRIYQDDVCAEYTYVDQDGNRSRI